MQVVLKAHRRQAKTVKMYVENGDDLISAYEAFEHHADSEELGMYHFVLDFTVLHLWPFLRLTKQCSTLSL